MPTTRNQTKKITSTRKTTFVPHAKQNAKLASEPLFSPDELTPAPRSASEPAPKKPISKAKYDMESPSELIPVSDQYKHISPPRPAVPKLKAKRTTKKHNTILSNPQSYYTNPHQEAFPSAVVKKLVEKRVRQNAKNRKVAQSQYEMTGRHTDFPISYERTQLEVPHIKTAHTNATKAIAAQHNNSRSTSSEPEDGATILVDLVSPIPSSEPKQQAPVARFTQVTAFNDSSLSSLSQAEEPTPILADHSRISELSKLQSASTDNIQTPSTKHAQAQVLINTLEIQQPYSKASSIKAPGNNFSNMTEAATDVSEVKQTVTEDQRQGGFVHLGPDVRKVEQQAGDAAFDRDGSSDSLIITAVKSGVSKLATKTAEKAPKSAHASRKKVITSVSVTKDYLMSGALQTNDAAPPKNSKRIRKSTRAPLPGAADNLKFSAQHTENSSVSQKRKRAASPLPAKDHFVASAPQPEEAPAPKKARFEYPACLGTNLPESSYNHSPYLNPWYVPPKSPAPWPKSSGPTPEPITPTIPTLGEHWNLSSSVPRMFQNPPPNDDQPELIEQARITTPIFDPIDYDSPTRPLLPPSPSPRSHQVPHHLLRTILPASVLDTLSTPLTTPKQVIEAVEKATNREVRKTREAIVGAIDGLLDSFGERRDLVDGSTILGFLERDRVIGGRVEKMSRCLQVYGVCEEWAESGEDSGK